MPLQNRVTPFGRLVADSARGLFMGNRGILHDEEKRIVGRPWRHPHWIICTLEFKGRRREIMAPRRYTELFFLDEATAFAAGHRPCAECRRGAYRAYLSAADVSGAGELDRLLHRQRVGPRLEAAVCHPTNLPDGSMVAIGEDAFLIWRGVARLWSPNGYGEPKPMPDGEVHVLTPALTLAALANGYRPIVHPTAEP